MATAYRKVERKNKLERYFADNSDLLIVVLVLFAICGFIAGGIASIKGRDAVGWFILGLLLNIVAILFVLIAPDNKKALDERGIEDGTRKRCDYCAEVINSKAVKCPYCHSEQPELPEQQKEESDEEQPKESKQND